MRETIILPSNPFDAVQKICEEIAAHNTPDRSIVRMEYGNDYSGIYIISDDDEYPHRLSLIQLEFELFRIANWDLHNLHKYRQEFPKNILMMLVALPLEDLSPIAYDYNTFYKKRHPGE